MRYSMLSLRQHLWRTRKIEGRWGWLGRTRSSQRVETFAADGDNPARAGAAMRRSRMREAMTRARISPLHRLGYRAVIGRTAKAHPRTLLWHKDTESSPERHSARFSANMRRTTL
ncbi:hypothetical protein BW247_12060 [Acidihalobacter ferrooxydans]|uniref:Uncharacterized protein n=1 Tax=Acidihalobacter ferrooxydans TaxID=1765967 RepID=A0A1P8UIS6_9GAMM|nr:hypothetical protein BW247_12060 [Acidihalobacter ferrooxydans]